MAGTPVLLKDAGAGMSIPVKWHMSELRILWVSALDGSLSMAWVEDESHLAGRVRVEGGCYGR